MADKTTIVFYTQFPPSNVPCWSMYRVAKEMIDARESFCTSQMCLLMDPKIQDYDRIEIRGDGRPIILERKSNSWGDTWETDSTDRELRMCHNLFYLWRAGEFDE